MNLKLNPVDFLTDIFDIATSVLYDITKDLVTGTIKEVVKEQLEKIVTSKITKFFDPSKPKPEEQELEKIRSKILEEIDTLAKEDPDFKISSNTIGLKNPRKKPILPLKDRDVDKELKAREERLEKIIAQRRKELGLPPKSNEENYKNNLPGWEPIPQDVKDDDSPFPEGVNSNDVTGAGGKEPPPHKWESIDKPKTETPWQKRINDAVRKIQIIQAGGEVNE